MIQYIGIRNALAALVVTVSHAAQAQAPSARIHAEAPSGGATIADPITVIVSISHPQGSTVLWPDTVEGIEPFEFAGIQPAPLTSNEPTEASNARLVVRAFETGELTLPSMTFHLISATGDTSNVSTAELPITIQSVGLEESDDIRGIKPPLGIPINWLVVAIWMLGLAALAVAGWYVYRRMARRRTDTVAPVPSSRPMPPHVIAHAALDELEQSDLLETGQIKRWYSEASAIIRVYIEGRYDVAAMELPSGDIIRQLEDRRLAYEAMDQFRDFFARADLVKFAKHRPTIEQCRSLVDSARKLIDLTMEAATPDAATVA